jgi:hypothetical protein
MVSVKRPGGQDCLQYEFPRFFGVRHGLASDGNFDCKSGSFLSSRKTYQLRTQFFRHIADKELQIPRQFCSERSPEVVPFCELKSSLTPSELAGRIFLLRRGLS